MKRVWKLQCEFADGKVDARARLYVIWLLKFYIVKKAAYVVFRVFFFFPFFYINPCDSYRRFIVAEICL